MEAVEALHNQSSNIYKVSRTIKRTEHSLYNSLRSIYQDSLFVHEISGLWPQLPLLANLRCGLWYSPNFHGTCYFKSTDGHTGNWSLNPTRLNMHVAHLAAQRGGCFIVDATRRGKRFPDSLSKTIPIWACVLNRAVYEIRELQERCTSPERDTGTDSQAASIVVPSDEGSITGEAAMPELCLAIDCMTQTWDCSLHLPLWVSDTEKESIEARIDEWVRILRASCADVASLAQGLKKPLRPLWISQKTVVWLNEVPDAASWSFTPVILVSASQPFPSNQRMSDGDFSWSYIPGAADDEESWARGLTPVLFWKHASSLINNAADHCKRMVADITERERVCRVYRGLEAEQIRVKSLKQTAATEQHHIAEDLQDFVCTNSHGSLSKNSELLKPRKSVDLQWIGETRIAIGSQSCQSGNVFDLVDCAISCGLESSSPSSLETSCLSLPVKNSKHDRFLLQNYLSVAVAFARERLKQGCKILIFCQDGVDLSICVCLAILLATFDERGVFDNGCNFAKAAVSKWDVRQRLVYICEFVSNARPSRGNLRQVYNFLCREFQARNIVDT